jgi:hypothetical protein
VTAFIMHCDVDGDQAAAAWRDLRDDAAQADGQAAYAFLSPP